MNWLSWLIFSVIGITVSLYFHLPLVASFLLTFGLAYTGLSIGSTIDGD